LPGGVGKELGCALGKAHTGIRYDQPNAVEAAFLEMLEEYAPASLVLLGAFTNAENLAIAVAVHADRHQQRHVAHLASPAALEHDAIQVDVGMLAFDRSIAPSLDRPIDLLVKL
jgi:electron transfer flavoprotein alpha subunit